MMYRKYSDGIIEVIAGPMFSGKSDELIKRIRILGYADVKTLVAKPEVDNRWDQRYVQSRTGKEIEAFTFKDAREILEMVMKNHEEVDNDKSKNEHDKILAVAVDEAQFFKENLVEVVETLAYKGVRVIISGLDQDFKGRPFGPMPQLLAIADTVQKQSAVCMNCRVNAGTMTYRKIEAKSDDTVLVGDEQYEARCRSCHQLAE